MLQPQQDESEDGFTIESGDGVQNNKFVQSKNMKNKRALRREQLSRLSSSCPSLDAGWRAGYTNSLDVTQEEDEEIAPDSPSTGQLRPHSLDDESILDEEDEVAAEAEEMNPGKNSSSSSLEDGLRSRLAKSRSSSKEDSRITAAEEERIKVKRTSSLAKKASSADDGPKVPGKSSLKHRASIADPRSHSSAAAAKYETTRMQVPAQAEATRAPVERRSSFKTPMAGMHSSSNNFASRLFGLDKSRSVSTPSINADIEPEQAEVGAALRLRAETHDPSKKVATVKRRPSLFANLFAGHHNHDDTGNRRKSESGHRLSMAFSILSGHHHHKGKDGNNEAKKYQHSYIPAPAIDVSPCGACGKPADGKQALQCTGCLVIVHDGCKNLPGIPCMKSSKLIQQKAHSLLQPVRHVTSMPPRYPAVVSNTMATPVRRNSLSSGALQDMPFITLTPEGSVISTMSGSVDSNTEDASSEDLEPDAELLPTKPGPESWSDTMDKKALKKLNTKYIQRQDCIWEFIASERQYVRSLKIAQKVFARGMTKYCHFSRDVIERLFPGLDSLVEMHVGFLERLLQRQNERADRSVDVVGDIVLEQFGGYLGARVKATYGRFVSRQRESMDCYKDLFRTNAYFEGFVKRTVVNPNAGHFTMPEIMNVIVQRMQKYRAHLDQLVKNTKESRDRFDKDNLTKASECVKRIMDHIEDATEQRKKELRLIDIYTRTDVRSVASFNGTSTFRKSDLLCNGRRLLFEGIVSCKNAREKESDILLLLLSDVLVFLQENSQKFSFFPPDSKSVVLPLDNVTVREKSSSKDNRTFSISRRSATHSDSRSTTHSDSERGDAIELSCKTPGERREWAEQLSKATHECESRRRSGQAIDDEDAVDSSSCKAVEQLARVNELIERLQVKEEEANTLNGDRLQISRDLSLEYGRVDEQGNISDIISTKYGDDNEFAQAVDLIRVAHVEVLRLASAYLAYPFAVTPPPIGAGPGDHMLPASQVAAHSQQRASIAATLLPPGSPLGHESFFGSFGRTKKLGRSVEDVRNAGRGSVDSDSDGTVAASTAAPRQNSSTKPQWIRKWVKDGSQGEGHPEQQSAMASTSTRQQRRRRSRTGRAASLVASVTRSLSLRDGKKPMVTTAQLTVPGFVTSSSSQPSGPVSPSALAGNPADATVAALPSASAPLQQQVPDCAGAVQVLTNASHLSEYLQAVLLITNSQDSTINRYKQLATEFNVRIRELNQELEKASQEKNAFPHNKQLEEIRSIREQLAAERQRWEAEKTEVQQHHEDERVHFEQLKHDLDLQREALAKEREDLLQLERLQPSVQDGVHRDPATLAGIGAATTGVAVTGAAAAPPEALLPLGRSMSADTRGAASEASSATAAAGDGSTGGHSPRWSSPLSQRRDKTKAATQGSATSVLAKMAAEVTAAGGLQASRDKKRPQTKR